MSDFTESFGNIIDFRQAGKVKYPLVELLFMAVIAVIANANTWSEIEI